LWTLSGKSRVLYNLQKGGNLFSVNGREQTSTGGAGRAGEKGGSGEGNIKNVEVRFIAFWGWEFQVGDT